MNQNISHRKLVSVLSLKRYKYWLWLIPLILCLPAGVGVWGVLQILYLPEIPNCESESWSSDAAAARFYCADKLANEQDADKLHQAIELVNTLPSDHPLRRDSDRLISLWSQAILRLAENTFQEGDLGKAVDMVKLIPNHLTIYQLADERSKQWQSIWSKSETIYKASADLVESDDRDKSYLALTKAKELWHVGNHYWGTTKYQELASLVQDAKEKKEQQQKMEADLKAKATAIPDANISSLDQSDQSLKKWQQEQDDLDLAQLNKAKKLATSGKNDDLRDAISEAYMVASKPHYEEAQKLIVNWQQQMENAEDRASLKRAKDLANQNDIASLETAISEARSINTGHSLSKEANRQIEQWNNRISKLHQATPPELNSARQQIPAELPLKEIPPVLNSEPQISPNPPVVQLKKVRN